jgi:hypothetical protein
MPCKIWFIVNSFRMNYNDIKALGTLKGLVKAIIRCYLGKTHLFKPVCES